ncbi:hypothetical protein [Paenibacillus lautus]
MPNYLYQVIQTIVEEKTITVVYHTQSQNQQTERGIDPYYLVPRINDFI